MQALRQQRPTVHVEHLKFFSQIRIQERTGSAKSGRRDKQPDIQNLKASHHRFDPGPLCARWAAMTRVSNAVPTTQVRCSLFKQALTTRDQDEVQSRRGEPKGNFPGRYQRKRR